MRVIESPIERLDVVESQQFDTQIVDSGILNKLDGGIGTQNSVMRFECEGTEVEIEEPKVDRSIEEIER